MMMNDFAERDEGKSTHELQTSAPEEGIDGEKERCGQASRP